MKSATTGEDAEEDPIGHEGGADQKQVEGGISLRGTWICRYLTPKPLNFESKDKSIRQYFVNFANLPENVAHWICWSGEFVLLAVTILLTIRSTARKRSGRKSRWSWGLAALAMLLISPLTRKAHLCALLIPAAAAIALIQQGRIRGIARILCIASLTGICVQGAVFSVEFIGKLNSDRMQMLGLNFWLLLAIYFAIARALMELQEFSVERNSARGINGMHGCSALENTPAGPAG